MKIQMLKALVATSALAALGLGATAANAATATGTARAKILRQVTVTNTSDLQFGAIVTGTAGTATVNTAGVRTCSAGLVCSGTTTAANFNITGSAAQVVTVALPGSVTLTSGGNNMTATLNSSAATVTLGAAGTGAFTVGGVLTVAAAQADGDYAGTFTATVDYQ